MEITPIHRWVVGLDVHQNKITACALIEQADGRVVVEQREFGGFKRDRRALAECNRPFHTVLPPSLNCSYLAFRVHPPGARDDERDNYPAQAA